MASTTNWGMTTGAPGHGEDYDSHIATYYNMYTLENVPPDMHYLSYPGLREPEVAPPNGKDPYFYFAEFYRRVLVEGLAGWAHSSPFRGRILATGCGLGGIGVVLLEVFPEASEIVCVDLVEHQIEVARQRLGHLSPHVVFEVGDVTSLRFADASFDLVFDEVALSHLKSEYLDKFPVAMREFRRVLRRDGRVILSGYNKTIERMSALARDGTALQEVRCVDISPANGLGAQRSLLHMYGPAVSRRTALLCQFLARSRLTRSNPIQIMETLGVHLRLTKTLHNADAFSELLSRIRELPSQEGVLFPDVDVAAENAAALVEEQEWVETGKVPSVSPDLLDRFPAVLDAILFGCTHCMGRGETNWYKGCFVLVLETVPNNS